MVLYSCTLLSCYYHRFPNSNIYKQKESVFFWYSFLFILSQSTTKKYFLSHIYILTNPDKKNKPEYNPHFCIIMKMSLLPPQQNIVLYTMRYLYGHICAIVGMCICGSIMKIFWSFTGLCVRYHEKENRII